MAATEEKLHTDSPQLSSNTLTLPSPSPLPENVVHKSPIHEASSFDQTSAFADLKPPSPSPLPENGEPKSPIYEPSSCDQTSAFADLKPPSPSPLSENVNAEAPNCSAQTSSFSNLRHTRRSPRLVDNGEASNANGNVSNRAKRHKRSESSDILRNSSDTVSFFIGDPVPDEEARQRWPWRYGLKGMQTEEKTPKLNNNDDDEDPMVLNVRCHYTQAEVEKCIFSLGDCAYVKGDERGQNYVAKILEFFQTIGGEDYFRVQWFFRAEDTVIKDEGKRHDKKRLFYSTLMNDNLLDCLVSKVNVVQIAPSVNLKSKAIPHCDFYYDMKYSVDYSTFCTDSSNFLVSPHTKEIHQNGNTVNYEESPNGDKTLKSELQLLDLYSGCGGMSTGLCLGAKLSNVELVTRWAVEIDKSACESLKINHPKTQIRNESAEDFFDLLKEWDRLCSRYANDIDSNSRFKRGSDKNVSIKPKNQIPSDEYEVASLVDICYGVCGRKTKRGLKFQVRWVGYGPSEDTWEPIEGLSNCEEKIKDFVLKGLKAKILPRPGDVAVICGGPPCQGISGYNRFRNINSPLDDERNRQIVVFMDIINFLKPKYILMENVVDILRFANGCLGRYALSRLVDMNYQARLGIMAAGCYGLPQFRLRVFLWGAHPQEKLPQFPLPTHDVVLKYGAPCEFERNIVAYDEGQPRDLEKALTLGDAISDLPPVTNKEVRAKILNTKQPETEFQKYIRATKFDMMGVSSSNNARAEKSVLYDHRPLPLFQDDYERVCRIPKQKGANFRDLPGVFVGPDNVVRRTDEPALMPSGKHWVPDYAINFGQGKSKRPFARLWWDETVPTVICCPDLHSQAILHPEQDRVLTVREYARLQGFHDYYEFCGDLKERYRQVGNAVAVPVGRALGYTLGMAVQKLGGDEPLMVLPPRFSHSTTIQLLNPSSSIKHEEASSN